MQYMPRGRQRREHLSPAPRTARTCAPLLGGDCRLAALSDLGGDRLRKEGTTARSVGLLDANAKDPHLTRSHTLFQPVAELRHPTIINYLQLNSLTIFQSLY